MNAVKGSFISFKLVPKLRAPIFLLFATKNLRRQKTQILINKNLEFFDLRKFLVAKRRKIGAQSLGTN